MYSEAKLVVLLEFSKRINPYFSTFYYCNSFLSENLLQFVNVKQMPM